MLRPMVSRVFELLEQLVEPGRLLDIVEGARLETVDGGVDGSVTGEKGRLIFRRTISTAAVKDGLVYVPDLTGYLHCVDLETGELGERNGAWRKF